MATASTTKSAGNGGEVVGTDNKKLSVQQLSSDTSPAESFKDWVARVPRKAVLHRMETAESLEDRVFWAIILWSWCGPQINDAVVIKNRSGYIQRDANGKPVPAKLLDLLALLGLAPAMKGNLSRAVQRLAAKGSIRYESRVLYPVKEPVAPERAAAAVAKGETFFIAGLVINIGEIDVSTDNDEVARTETIRWLGDLSTKWKTGLKNLKTEFRELVVQGISERPIFIGLEEKKRRRDIEKKSSSSSAVSTPAVATTLQPEKAEEEDSRSPYQKFKDTYPPDHFDEARAKPSFDQKTKPEKRQILDRLQIYLTCESWLDGDGRWIPLASNWLKSYWADPPPLLKPHNTKSKSRSAFEAFMAQED
jgi:hypothetical protein